MKADADFVKGFMAGRSIAVRLAEIAEPIEVNGIALEEPETEDEES